MIRISKLADYAVVLLAALSREEGRTANAGILAAETRLPEPTVAKVLKALAREDIVQSLRGANGGYKMARSPSAVSVEDILLAVDGPVSLTACIEGSHENCDFRCHCLMRGRWDSVNEAVRSALEGISLADMTGRPDAPRTQKRGKPEAPAFMEEAGGI